MPKSCPSEPTVTYIEFENEQIFLLYEEGIENATCIAVLNVDSGSELEQPSESITETQEEADGSELEQPSESITETQEEVDGSELEQPSESITETQVEADDSGVNTTSRVSSTFVGLVIAGMALLMMW